MKKYLVLIPAVFWTVLSYAQPKIGLTVSPGLSMSRVKYLPNDDTQVDKGDLAFRAKFGLEFDFPVTNNYAVSTGLIYAPKRVSIETSNFDEATTTILNQKEEYKAQYLQIPLTLKLFTSEIQPDLRVFFQLGFMGEILLYNEKLDRDNVLVEDFRFFDFSFTGGAGLEFGPEINSQLYGGIFYDRGLVNIIHKQNSDLSDDLAVRMDMIHLKLGIKF